MANKKKKKIESFEQLAETQQHKRPEASKEEPAISNALDEFELWMATNWKKVIIGVCAFAVVVSIVIIIQGLIKNAKEKARKELANATTIAEREAAIKKHPTHDAADFERIELAGALIENGKPEDMEKARDYHLAVANSTKNEPFIRISTELLAAHVYEKLGKTEEAAAEFERIANRTQTPDDLRAEAAFYAALLFASLNQNDKAGAMLNIINLKAAAEQGDSSVYGGWATRAKFLDEKIRPKVVSLTIPKKTAEAQPAVEAQAPAEEAVQPEAGEQAPAEDVTIQPVL